MCLGLTCYALVGHNGVACVIRTPLVSFVPRGPPRGTHAPASLVRISSSWYSEGSLYMKSLLQEAPSIEKAVFQAWESAGRPAEFSVKIHEQGKSGFFGFMSTPAVVSITYKPIVAPAAAGSRTQKPGGMRSGSDHGRAERPERSERSERTERPDRHDRHDRHERPERSERTERPERSERSERSERAERPERHEHSERVERSDRSEASDRSEGSYRGERSERSERSDRGDRNDRRRSGDRRDSSRRSDRSSGPSSGVRARGLLSYEEGEEGYAALNPDSTNMNSYADAVGQSSGESHYQGAGHDDNGAGDSWEASYVDSINSWLNEIISTIGYDVTFESSVSGKILHVEFSSDFVADAELSRSLYAALSFVLLQFLKREHKRRFRGLRIALTHPGQEPLRFDLGS